MMQGAGCDLYTVLQDGIFRLNPGTALAGVTREETLPGSLDSSGV